MGISQTVVASPAQILVQPFSESYPKISGRVYHSVATQASNAAQSMGADFIQAAPFFLSKKTTFSDIVAFVVTPAVGGKVRIGIYAADGASFYPTSLILDSGELSGASGNTEIGAVINKELDAGFYWLASLCNDVIITLDATDATQIPAVAGSYDMDSDHFGGYKKIQAYGALPAIFPAAASKAYVYDVVGLKVA